MLDMEHGMSEFEENGVRKVQVLHSHYLKPIANAFFIRKESAVSERNKESIQVADLT